MHSYLRTMLKEGVVKRVCAVELAVAAAQTADVGEALDERQRRNSGGIDVLQLQTSFQPGYFSQLRQLIDKWR